MSSIYDIPDEIVIYIFSFLPITDIKSLLCVDSRFCRLSSIESLWKRLCRNHCFVEERTSDSWKGTYLDYYRLYGPYLDTENELLRTWRRLMKIVKAKLPIIYDSLLDGIDEEMIDKMESTLQAKFPSSLRFLYRMCEGQQALVTHATRNQPGLFGSFQDPYLYERSRMISIQFLPVSKQGLDSSLRNDTKCIKYLPIAKAGASWICIVLPKITHHQSADSRSPPPHTIVWINWQQDRIFHIADSLQDWLQEYTDRLSNGQYVIERGRVLRYFYHPDSVCTTGSITVKAGWYAATITGHEIQYEYRIILEMKEDADPTEACQLMSRHWDIDRGIGNTTVREVVDGEGVVGQRPVMKPGVTFSWVSRTFFRKPGGNMSGYFTMRNLSTHVLSRVVCPRFTMPFPKEYLDSSEVES